MTMTTTTINADTIARATQLGETVATASAELEALLRQLSAEADAQLAVAAAAYIAQHQQATEPHSHLMVDYKKAHDGLLSAAVAASNLRDTAERATTLRSKCDWWKHVASSGQRLKDFTLVCSTAAAAAQSK